MTPSPVLWGQEKFRDTNNASDGYGKWFARIGYGSVRQLPYSLKVEGRTTYIVGYSYTPTGTQEPTVGNDWYPVNLDNYDNQEYASVDAYIASEYGQATLQGCGVTALVPLATAIQRLAENDINITVRQGLYIRSNGGQYGLLVDKEGKYVGDSSSYGQPFRVNIANSAMEPIADTDPTVASMVAEYGRSALLISTPGAGWSQTIDGILYTGGESAGGLTLTPWPPTW